ncbi:tape measure protein [Ectopseudomonas mendocina]|uniref:Tape measure protein n=1 Tax=Ectopseudomonas mendocina TaxID=300 RepID=A0ABZ2RAG6_ECTME
MSEKVGSIYYEVEADASKLVNSTNDVDAALGKAQRSMGKTDASASSLNARMNKLASSIRSANQQVNAQTSAYSGLTKVVAAYLSMRTLQAAIAMSDQYGQMASRIRNATDSADEYEKVQARLLQTANGTYRALSEAQEVYLATADTLRDLGYTTDDVLDITDSFSYALVRDAARADQATTAMDAYSKALMKGKVEADGWASIMAATPSIVNGIAEATGRSAEEIRNLGATGKLSVEALNEGLRRSRDENKAMADEMETSVNDAFVKLQNSMTLFIGKMNESSGASSILTENVALLADALQDPETIKAAQDLAGGVVAALNAIISGAKQTVDVVRWAAESIAAALGGAAGDDIVRLQEQLETYQEMLSNPLKRLRIGGKGQAVAFFSEEEIKTNIAATQRMIDDFYKEQQSKPPVAVPNIEPPKSKASGVVSAIAPTASRPGGSGKSEEQKTADAIKKRIESLELEAETLGMSKTELELYTLQLDGATDAQIRQAATARALIDAYDQQAKAAEDAAAAEEKRRAKFGDDPTAYVRGDVSPLSGGEFDNQYARYAAEEAEEIKRYEAQMARLREAEQLRIEVIGGYQAQEQAMAQEHADRLEQIEQAKNQVLLATGQNLFGELASATAAFAGEQSGLYKAMFAASKAFALADAAIKIQQGIAAAASLTWPANLSAMASVASATGSIISTIGSIAMPGRALGGPTQAGQMYRINETGAPEIWQNSTNGQQYMMANTRGEVISNKDAVSANDGGMPNVIVNIHNNASGATATASSRMQDRDFIIDVVVNDGYQGGPVGRMVNGITGSRRAAG